MQIHHRTLDEVINASDIIIEADIIDRPSITHINNTCEEVTFTVQPTQLIKGKLSLGKPLKLIYAQALPHQRSNQKVSPLITGSGIELIAEKGNRQIVLIKEENHQLSLLRLETLDRKNEIKHYLLK